MIYCRYVDIVDRKPTRLHYTIVLFIIPIKQAKEFAYNTNYKYNSDWSSFVHYEHM